MAGLWGLPTNCLQQHGLHHSSPVLRQSGCFAPIDGQARQALRSVGVRQPGSHSRRTQQVEVRAVQQQPEPAQANPAENAPNRQGDSEASSSDNGAAPPAGLQDKIGVRVRVRNMHKQYKTKEGLFNAVVDVDVDIAPNKIVALLGPSGSGKTTLLRLIAGLEEATSGSIFFDDEDATNVPTQERRIGFVFQSYALFRHMTVAQNIAFGPRIRKLDVDIDKRVDELLELVELPGYGKRKPNQLSGGQRQRVALARALASNPRLLLLDEPFGALDPQVRAALRASVKEIIHRVGVTSILVTHDQEEAFDLADTVVIFNRGRVQQVGSPEDVLRHPVNPFVMHFVHDVNQLRSNALFVKRMGFKTQKPMVMFKPSDVRILTQPPPPELQRRYLPATIYDRINARTMLYYFLRFDDGLNIEMHVTPEKELELDLEVQQRVYAQVKPMHFMGYTPEEIDSTPLI
ncbi:hypothetical protein WJX72_008238 [[Myrmecia] bisecta]|uniref:ABC transporter domain-containing protein n=1 Tax=[Myrmecia] bisecta TaxID=41462 RepID=A0AAW1QC81_9CHLO